MTDRNMEVNEKAFESAFMEFNKIGRSNEKISNFKNHPLLIKHENYKYEIKEEAKNQLLTNTWKESDLGTGRILTCIKNSINLKSNNLIDWRKKDDFKKLEANKENEKLLFDFFKTKIDDENAFNQFHLIGFSYQLIAYLFFIKNPQKYMPISQGQFDKVFDSLGIDFKTNHNCSWGNYLEYNDIIKQFRKHLSQRFQNVSLLDAHSFLWIYGFQFDTPNDIETCNQSNSIKEHKINEQPLVEPKKEFEIYQPKKVVDIEDLTDNENDIDYLENHRKLMEIGDAAEKIVLENEIGFLKVNFPTLADKVRLVSNDPRLGFDILSFETDGKQKQIEVKAISENKNCKSFIISRNELSKSKTYSNYYIYCVTEINSEKPNILRIKNPDFENSNRYLIEPLTFKIMFE